MTDTGQNLNRSSKTLRNKYTRMRVLKEPEKERGAVRAIPYKKIEEKAGTFETDDQQLGVN
uniref:Uncharacterized protein n=1 Tax=Hyaloperonospora arabidopsidis (strain Emoy2) TaxID=559515 RepID=M4BJ63_HYAAE